MYKKVWKDVQAWFKNLSSFLNISENFMRKHALFTSNQGETYLVLSTIFA